MKRHEVIRGLIAGIAVLAGSVIAHQESTTKAHGPRLSFSAAHRPNSVSGTNSPFNKQDVHIRLQAWRCAVASPGAMAAARAIIARRILALGVRQPSVAEVGRCGIDVVASGVKDLGQFIATIGATGYLAIYGMGTLPSLKVGATFPYALAYTFQNSCDAAKPPSPCILITGAELDRSTISVGRDSRGVPLVNAGTKGGIAVERFRAYTGAHIGQHMAIVLDGKVISDPPIQAQLSTGWRITGLRSVEEADTIAISLKYGALPIAFTIVAG